MSLQASCDSIFGGLRPLQPLKPTNVARRVRFAPSLKAVVFDLYGTLIISKSGDVDGASVQGASLMGIFRENGFDLSASIGEDEWLARLEVAYKETIAAHKARLREKEIPHPEINIVLVWEDIVKSFLDEGLLLKAGSLESLVVGFECATNPTYPMPGLGLLIESLDSNGFVLGVISNAQFYTPLLMNYFFSELRLAKLFSVLFPDERCLYSYKLGRAKPDPYAFEAMKNRLQDKQNIKPEEVLYVGNDMLKDVFPASEVGFLTALFAGDSRSLRLREGNEKVSGLQPDFTLSTLLDVLEIVGVDAQSPSARPRQ